jgi:hypothetical protein
MHSPTTVTVIASRPSRSGRHARIALAVVGAFIMLATADRAAEAQTSPDENAVALASPTKKPAWEFLVSSGNIVPTGGQRDAIKRSNLTVAQLSYVVRPPIAITASIGWARSRDIASVGDPRLDVFTYDLGTEFRARGWITGHDVTFRPFTGAGAGARSYNYRSLEVDARHNVSGYVAAGGELGFKRVGLRLEVRDYVSGFKPLSGGGTARTGNDVVVMAGLRFGTR